MKFEHSVTIPGVVGSRSGAGGQARASAPARNPNLEPAPPLSLLDIGTGSGILAIAAAKLGYSPVRCFDFDPESVRVAKANAAQNGVAHLVKPVRRDLTKLPHTSATRYHVICANLIYDLLIVERDRILARLRPDGVLMSPGPGDPMLLDHVVQTARGLIGRTPIMGICLGHQVIGRVFGASTYKLKFGHRGANHSVRDELTGKVYITSQNHGFAVDGDHLDAAIQVSQVHINDGTVEGLQHRELPLFTIQYHSEASPGPRDNMYVFDQFLDLVKA